MTGTLRISAAGAAPPPPPPVTHRPTVHVPAPVTQPVRHGNAPTTYTVQVIEPGAPTDWGFSPASLGARAGDTVIWKNTGAAPHTITASDKSFDSGNLDPGKTFTRKFTSATTVNYFCTLHPWMKGVIVVAAAGAPVIVPHLPKGGSGSSSGGSSIGGSANGSGTGDGNEVGVLDPKHSSRSLFAIASLALITLLGAAASWPTARELVRRARAPQPEPIPVEVVPTAPPAPTTKRRAVAVSVPAKVELPALVIDEEPATPRRKRELTGAGRR